MTPTKGARAGDSVKTFGNLKYVKKDCFNDPESPIPDTAELQLTVVRDKHIVSGNPYRLKVTLHNAQYGEEYYVYFPYEKNSLTTGDDNTRFSALLTTGECDSSQTMMIYAGDIYQDENGDTVMSNDVYCFDGTSWEKVGTIPFIGRYSFDNVAIYHMESVAKAKNGIVFVNTSVDGGGNIFLYNTKTNTCEPLYYTTDDTIVDCYNEQSSCAATEDGIYFARKSGYGINENYELYLLPADSGAYESLYSGSALLGDVDGDGSVTVADATCIRRELASIPLPFEFDENVADVDRDGEVTIVDVTMIQRWLVELPAADGIGKPIG